MNREKTVKDYDHDPGRLIKKTLQSLMIGKYVWIPRVQPPWSTDEIGNTRWWSRKVQKSLGVLKSGKSTLWVDDGYQCSTSRPTSLSNKLYLPRGLRVWSPWQIRDRCLLSKPEGYHVPSPSQYWSYQSYFPCRDTCGQYLLSPTDLRIASPQQAYACKFPQLRIPAERLAAIFPGSPLVEFICRPLVCSPTMGFVTLLSPVWPWVLIPSRFVGIHLQYDMTCYHPRQSCCSCHYGCSLR